MGDTALPTITDDRRDRGDRLAQARELVARCMDLPMILDGIGDDDDLAAYGVDSGVLLVAALNCEKLLGRALDDAELSALTSLSAIADLLGGTAPNAPGEQEETAR
jgi:acyl carrier protein